MSGTMSKTSRTLVEHVAMLSGDADVASEVRAALEGEDHRRQLDRLGTRAEDDGDLVGSCRGGGIHEILAGVSEGGCSVPTPSKTTVKPARRSEAWLSQLRASATSLPARCS